VLEKTVHLRLVPLAVTAVFYIIFLINANLVQDIDYCITHHSHKPGFHHMSALCKTCLFCSSL